GHRDRRSDWPRARGRAPPGERSRALLPPAHSRAVPRDRCHRPPVTSIRGACSDLLSRISETVPEMPKLCRLANVTNTEVPGTKAWPREDQALLSLVTDRLAFVRHRQAGLPKRTIASGKFCAPISVAFDGVFFQCSPVGRGDQALRRQNAGGRAA